VGRQDKDSEHQNQVSGGAVFVSTLVIIGLLGIMAMVAGLRGHDRNLGEETRPSYKPPEAFLGDAKPSAYVPEVSTPRVPQQAPRAAQAGFVAEKRSPTTKPRRAATTKPIPGKRGQNPYRSKERDFGEMDTGEVMEVAMYHDDETRYYTTPDHHHHSTPEPCYSSSCDSDSSYSSNYDSCSSSSYDGGSSCSSSCE
jgi:hypothetical protein